MENQVTIHLIPSTLARDTVMIFDRNGQQITEGYVVDHERGTVTFGTWEDALRARVPA